MSFSIAPFKYDQVMMVTHILRSQSSNLYLPSLASFVYVLFILLLVLRLCGIGGNRRREKAISLSQRVWDMQGSEFITELGLTSSKPGG